MAIVFDCPHCKTNYRLKDDLAGKTATCKNPNCRKVIPIPKATVAVAAKPVDVDALAAAMFSDEQTATAEKAPEEMIAVTCTGCDHTWKVEASKEGKNVLCPECRKPTRVPPRKKEQKADWRTGEGRPSLAKVETGLDVQGAWSANQAGGISQPTAKEIVKDRDAQEEPEVKRKRLIKRLVLAVLLIGVASAGGYYVIKQRRVAKDEGQMDVAVKEVKDSTKDARFPALILRASGEYQARTATKDEEIKKAFLELRTAKNLLTHMQPARGSNCDQNGALAEVAMTVVDLLGTDEQVKNRERMTADKDVLGEFRNLLTAIADSELRADTIRAITRKCVEREHLSVALTVAGLLENKDEMLGQVGLELLRIDAEKYRNDVQKIVASIPASQTGDPISIRTLRLIMPKQQPVKKDAEPVGFSYISSSEEKAFKGQLADVPKGLGSAKPEERIRALTAAAQVAIDKSPKEAASLLEAAAKEAQTTKGLVTPWVGVRICRLLAKAGKFDVAEALAGSAALQDDEAKSWARLAILRGRLEQSNSKADDAWLDLIGDPTKSAAAAKAREEIARHNARHGQDYPAMTNWEKGKVKPFGVAGTLLGKLDK